MTIVRPTYIYECEVWPMTVQIEQKLRSFESKVLRKICARVFGNVINAIHLLRYQIEKKRGIRDISNVTLYNKLRKGLDNLVVLTHDEKRRNK